MLPKVTQSFFYYALVGVAVLLGLATAARPFGVEAVGRSTFAAPILSGVQSLATRVENTCGAVANAVPRCVQPHLRQLLAGATSIALVGGGLCNMPRTAGPAAPPSSPLPARVSGAVAAGVSRPVEKLFYALGGILTELLLLSVLVRPRAAGERARGLFATHAGWLLLVACVALPGGAAQLGFLTALVARLPLETYAPALVIGKLLQPYVAAALWEVPVVCRLMQMTSWRVPKNSDTLTLWTNVALSVVPMILVACYMCFAPAPEDKDADGAPLDD